MKSSDELEEGVEEHAHGCLSFMFLAIAIVIIVTCVAIAYRIAFN